MSLHLLVAGAVLLSFAATAKAQNRAFRAEVQPAYAAAPSAAQTYRPHQPSPGTGFSGAFDVRQTVRNLGY